MNAGVFSNRQLVFNKRRRMKIINKNGRLLNGLHDLTIIPLLIIRINRHIIHLFQRIPLMHFMTSIYGIALIKLRLIYV